MISSEQILELQRRFKDIVNHDADDPLAPIDPISYRTPEGDSCLHIAAIRGDLLAAQLLVEAGLDVNAIGDLGNTPLHYALRHRHGAIAELLLANGASSTISNELGSLPDA